MSELNIGLLVELITHEDLDVAGAVVSPMIRGFFTGIALAVVAYLLLKAFRLIRMDTPAIAKIAVTLWLIILLPTFFAARGFYSGLNHATQSLLTETDLVNTIAPGVGEEIATFVLQLDSKLRELSGLPDGDGESLDTVQFTELCKIHADNVIRGILPEISSNLKSKSALISSGLGGSIFDWFVEKFGEGLTKDLLTERLDRTGTIGEWFHGLSQSKKQMNKIALANYSAESLVRGAITRPFVIIDRIQRTSSMLLLFFIFNIPAIALWFLNRSQTRKLLEMM